uniref:Putative conserved plasma membrane protein n=1 Tax=Lutzomyia longipalpis TaxID=7200 RepID=A0A1B0GL76_LUTLO
MDNPAFSDATAVNRQKMRRFSRAASVAIDNEASPFSPTSPRFKTVAPTMMVRWRNDPQAMMEDQGEGFEYMEVGPSPPAESAPSMYDSFEEPSTELSVQICSETIRGNLLDQMKTCNGRVKVLEDIEQRSITTENAVESFRNVILHFSGRPTSNGGTSSRDSSRLVLISTTRTPMGISALHLAAFSGCVRCTAFLISCGIDVNLQTKCYTPLHCAAFGNSPETAKMLINSGANIATVTAKQDCEESLLHCAVRANAVDCVRLFIAEGADVNSLKPNGTNPIHLAAYLGHVQCLEVLLETKAADLPMRGNVECINLLLGKGADVKLRNHRGFTALHLAARSASLECCESLLRTGNADPNAEDFDHRTALHAAIGKSDQALDILETLIAWGANINHKDVYGFTALHLAALDGLAHFNFHGADVTTKSKKGTSALNVITRKTPASLQMISQKLDAAITCHQSHDTANREVELELDFRQLLQYCHPREISYMNTFVDEGQKEFLQHPLCSAFLYIKWGKIRKYYIGRLVFCFMFVLFLTLYVLTALAHNCYNSSKEMEEEIQEQELCQKQSILGNMLRNNPFVIEMQWWVLVAITIVEIFRKLCGISGFSSFRQYVTQFENLIEWFVIVSVFVISYIYTHRTYTWQNHIGAFAVLLGWTNLMLMIGQLPVFGAYVAMYTKVQGEFAKLFMAYSCMLIGFTISFCVIFPSSSLFANPFMGFISVLVLMIGEQDLSLLTNDPDDKDPPFLLEISAQITFVLFLLFVTVILMNLLVGIAVHDIQALKVSAELSKLVRQTKLISYIESALFNGYLPAWLRRLLHNTALVSPQAYRVVLCVKPLNPGEKRLPRDILKAAYEVGRQRKHFGHTISARNSTATYFSYKNPIKLDAKVAEGKLMVDNNNVNIRSGESDCGFETESICTLTTKVEESAEKIEMLTNEVKELKAILHQNHALIDQVMTLLSKNQHNTNHKSHGKK